MVPASALFSTEMICFLFLQTSLSKRYGDSASIPARCVGSECLAVCSQVNACFHVPSQSPCPSPSPSKYNIVPMVTVCLTGRMGTQPILSAKWSVSIDTMINFDVDGDGHGQGDGTCKQAIRPLRSQSKSSHYKLCDYKRV